MREIEAFCEKWGMLPREGLVLCAVSGGRDSMALLHWLWRAGERCGFSVAAAHFNHRLRASAQRDEDIVRSWCIERKIPCYVGGADVAQWSLERGVSQEIGARTLRYAYLEKLADELGAVRIATAHHRQDNAETVLLNLLRGTGLQGLTGIPPVRGRIVRPLLETDRSEIERYIEEHHIPYGEDETNHDPAYTGRNRLRLDVLPVLEEIQPGCTGRIARMTASLREENDCLQRQAEALLEKSPVENGCIGISAELLKKQERAVARRIIRTMARRLDGELSSVHVDAVLALDSGKCVDLPGDLRAVCRRRRLTLERRIAAPAAIVLRSGEQIWGNYRVCLSRKETEGLRLAADRIDGPLMIGPWDGTGRLTVENGSRTIKRLFADRGIPVERREEYPALYLAGRVIAVFGVAVDLQVQPAEGDAVLTVSLEKVCT